MQFRWLGAAGVELRAEGAVLAIDPFFTRPPLRRVWFGRIQPDRSLIAGKIERCDAVLVSHAHHDHLMDAPEVVRLTGAVALGSENTCQILRLSGVPDGQIRQIQAGEQLSFGPFRIDVLPGEHLRIPGFSPGPLRPGLRPPLRLRDYRMDSDFCFLIQAEGCRVLVWAGDNCPHVPLADALFLGVIRKADSLEAILRQANPRLVIPIHWDDFFRPLTKPLRPSIDRPRLAFPPLPRVSLAGFQRSVAAIHPGSKVFVPQIFRLYDLDACAVPLASGGGRSLNQTFQ